MNTPRMMPGQQAPYTGAELRQLYAMVGAAAAGDPGERNEPHPQLARLERVASQLPPAPTCRCCGRELTGYAALQARQDGAGIHTRCITRHWGRHSHGVNVSRCREFAGAGSSRGRVS